MRKILVIGNRGMVGSSLVRSAQKKGIEVVGVARPEVDVCSMDELRACVQAIQPTHIINCTAYTAVDAAEEKEPLAFAVNAGGAEHCARVAQEIGARFLHLSTDYVFSGESIAPYVETDVCSPINVYGRSKWEGEKRVLAVNPSACIVRTSWVFGGNSNNLISSLLSRFLVDKEIRVVSDQIGKPTYCEDLVEALFTLLEVEGIVHFANQREASRYEIAQTLLQLAKQCKRSVVCEQISPVKSVDFPTPAKRPLYSVLDTSRYTLLTSIQPRPWTIAAEEFLRDV